MGSRDLQRIYAIDRNKWTVLEEKEAPGIPWAAVATGETLRFTIGEGADDDRYIRRFIPKIGFSDTERFACPEFTGSYLSYDGEYLYLSNGTSIASSNSMPAERFCASLTSALKSAGMYSSMD